jgi:uncharacterized protein (UPF0335 family)
MDTVRKDLKQKIEQMERVEKEKRKNNDIKIVTSERDFFRQEAIRLNQLCKELSSKNEDMTRELKFQTNELINISKKWKESENTNKQLIVELERNIQVNKELEYQFKLSQENAIPNQINNNMPINENIEEENYEIVNKDKLIRIIEKFKIDLKKERIRNHKILAELNKIMLDQNKLEKIFIDCVEEGRKEIFNRKFKDSFANRTMSFNSMSKTGTIPYINDIKYDNFLPSDKRKLLEVFMMKEEVINLIKDHVFKKIEYGSSVYETKTEFNQLNSTRNSFLKTDKLFSVRKKKPNSGFTYTMQIRSKTPNINNI